MKLPTIPEQVLEAHRLCAKSRRLMEEVRAAVAACRERWEKVKRDNETRWNVRFAARVPAPTRACRPNGER